MEYNGFTYTPIPKTAWDNLSMLEKSEMMKVAVRNGITDLKTIREKYNEFAEGGDTNPHTVEATVDALYASNPREEFLGEPSHHYDFTQSEEWANEHGYYPDARGHRDDRVKKPTHPSHPSRGIWNGDKFELTDLGMQNPNYTLFGLNDGEQDPQAVLTYQGGIVLPEVTVTPNENYFYNPYDNIILHQKANGGKIHIKPENRGKFTALKERTGHSATWFKEHGTPAQKKMAVFALNSRHWKHGLGGNLFDGNSQPTQKMQMGLRVTNNWKPFTLGDVLANAARIEQQKQALENRFSNDLVLSNDATSVANDRPQNIHLERKAVEGAKSHAAWEKEHPILNTVGFGLSTIPFVAAASPILAPAGEAFAGTTLAGISAPMLTDAALTAGFGAHGLQDLASGNADWMTALEVAPLGRLAKPMFNESTLAIENYRYPLGRPQVPDGYLTIKPQIKSYNNNITEVPFFTWGNDSRFKVSPTKESYKELHSQLSAAKKYKESPEYADLVRKAAQESEKLGIGDFPEDLFTAPNGKSIKLIFENRPKGQLGEYVPEDNVMKLDMLQSEGMEVPYHEGIHWQRVGNPDNIGPNFSKWWKARKSGQSDDVQQKLFENFRNSEEYNRYIKRRNADRYLEYKVDNALYPFADDYLRARGELQAHGLEAGRAIGLKPFLPYPGMKSALNAIDKARGYNPYLNDVKSGGEENVKRFWNILTGQYAPSLIPLGLVGTGYGLTNK